MVRILTIISLLVLLGCDTAAQVEWVVNKNVPDIEVPNANLPPDMHQKNWVDRGGAGSCVHASTVYALRWQGADELAEWWRRNHAGGETARTITNQYAQAGVKFCATFDGDPNFLDWVSSTRRAAIFWWKPYHCCTFLGWSNVDGKVVGVVADNNRPGVYEYHDRETLIRKWRGYGGFAAVPMVGSPHSPLFWPSLVPKQKVY